MKVNFSCTPAVPFFLTFLMIHADIKSFSSVRQPQLICLQESWLGFIYTFMALFSKQLHAIQVFSYRMFSTTKNKNWKLLTFLQNVQGVFNVMNQCDLQGALYTIFCHLPTCSQTMETGGLPFYGQV